MRPLWRRRAAGPRSSRRSFVTPEGVDLQLELGAGGARAGAFVLDALTMLALLVAMTVAIAYAIPPQSKGGVLAILWLLGFFLLRNGWFALFEMGSRGATPGKRLMGLRVVARDGKRLTGAAVIARNAMREVEVFLPLSFLGYQTSQGSADAFLVIFALLWSGQFLFFPLFNSDRLRLGDVVAGTWVVRAVRGELGDDLGVVARQRRVFPDAALDLYGIYELQALEDVLRTGREEAISTVAWTIRGKAGLADDGDDRGFLEDYYAALCVRLERAMLLGRRREDKFAQN
ncbi:RDD family protein [Sphingomonas sp.]|uniref:RDD family protein n=1 Tax=Sphingomonas sp. TaxID=28214 RepID=UPI0035BBBE34